MSDQKTYESNQTFTADERAPSKQPRVETRIILQQLSLPLAQTSACDVCGRPFEIVRSRGRPQRFCSDECRATQLKAQKRDWSHINWVTKRAARNFQPEKDGDDES